MTWSQNIWTGRKGDRFVCVVYLEGFTETRQLMVIACQHTNGIDSSRVESILPVDSNHLGWGSVAEVLDSYVKQIGGLYII
jgi:predicted ATP-dependent serine protease